MANVVSIAFTIIGLWATIVGCLIALSLQYLYSLYIACPVVYNSKSRRVTFLQSSDVKVAGESK